MVVITDYNISFPIGRIDCFYRRLCGSSIYLYVVLETSYGKVPNFRLASVKALDN